MESSSDVKRYYGLHFVVNGHYPLGNRNFQKV